MDRQKGSFRNGWLRDFDRSRPRSLNRVVVLGGISIFGQGYAAVHSFCSGTLTSPYWIHSFGHIFSRLVLLFLCCSGETAVCPRFFRFQGVDPGSGCDINECLCNILLVCVLMKLSLALDTRGVSGFLCSLWWNTHASPFYLTDPAKWLPTWGFHFVMIV